MTSLVGDVWTGSALGLLPRAKLTSDDRDDPASNFGIQFHADRHLLTTIQLGGRARRRAPNSDTARPASHATTDPTRKAPAVVDDAVN
ncbi:uncharacterized protein PG998_008992 [Apiospora kogelbergensis]|uniref:uncharacterized protein n=1 Tax=Apiospora kogelbergensis TaxID=1337665 RepID=UPI00312F389F